MEITAVMVILSANLCVRECQENAWDRTSWVLWFELLWANPLLVNTLLQTGEQNIMGLVSTSKQEKRT